MEAKDLVTPGENIIPMVTDKQLEQMALELYALRILEVKNLNSYDDLNFHITVKLDDVIPEDMEEPEYVNTNIPEVNEDGYVLKIVNSHASARPDCYDMQTKAFFHLKEHHIRCPEPVKDIDGNYFQLRSIHKEDREGNRLSDKAKLHLVCLLTYVPGEVVLKHPDVDVNFFHEIGVFAGQVSLVLKDFDHDFLHTPSRLVFDLQNASSLRQYLYATSNPRKRSLLSNVLDAFEKNVLPNLDSFEKATIHGDQNEQNILYQYIHGEPVINTIIDLGDMSRSYTVFDLAVLLMHFMCMDSGAHFLWTGGEVLKGFRSQVAISRLESELLPYIVMMRYATYLAMSQYTSKINPANAMYVCKLAPAGWKQLEQMWETPRSTIANAWELPKVD